MAKKVKVAVESSVTTPAKPSTLNRCVLSEEAKEQSFGFESRPLSGGRRMLVAIVVYQHTLFACLL